MKQKLGAEDVGSRDTSQQAIRCEECLGRYPKATAGPQIEDSRLLLKIHCKKYGAPDHVL